MIGPSLLSLDRVEQSDVWRKNRLPRCCLARMIEFSDGRFLFPFFFWTYFTNILLVTGNFVQAVSIPARILLKAFLLSLKFPSSNDLKFNESSYSNERINYYFQISRKNDTKELYYLIHREISITRRIIERNHWKPTKNCKKLRTILEREKCIQRSSGSAIIVFLNKYESSSKRRKENSSPDPFHSRIVRLIAVSFSTIRSWRNEEGGGCKSSDGTRYHPHSRRRECFLSGWPSRFEPLSPFVPVIAGPPTNATWPCPTCSPLFFTEQNVIPWLESPVFLSRV